MKTHKMLMAIENHCSGIREPNSFIFLRMHTGVFFLYHKLYSVRIWDLFHYSFLLDHTYVLDHLYHCKKQSNFVCGYSSL